MTIFVAELYVAARKIAPHKARAGSSGGGGGGGGGGGDGGSSSSGGMLVGAEKGAQIELDPEGDEGFEHGLPPRRPRPATNAEARSPRRAGNNAGEFVGARAYRHKDLKTSQFR